MKIFAKLSVIAGALLASSTYAQCIPGMDMTGWRIERDYYGRIISQTPICTARLYGPAAPPVYAQPQPSYGWQWQQPYQPGIVYQQPGYIFQHWSRVTPYTSSSRLGRVLCFC